MNKVTSMTKLSICIALSVASYSASAATSTQPAKAPENLAQNVSNLVYHSAQLPVVAYKHKEIIGKLLRGEVVNPSDGLFGAFLSGTASLLNGDLGKLIKLSGDFGPHFKGIQDNAYAIKSSVEKSLPGAVVNLISNTPNQIYTTVNSTLDYVADAAVERSKEYQEEKKKAEENNKNLLSRIASLDSKTKEIERKNQSLEKANKALEIKSAELEQLKKDLENAKEQLEIIKQAQETSNAAQTETIAKVGEEPTTAVEPKSAGENVAEKEKTASVNTADRNTKVQALAAVQLATVQHIANSAQDLAAVRNDVAKLQYKYHQLQNTVQENRNVSSRGIASIAAMANIPVPAVAGKTTIGAGVGHFDSKNAIAVGVSRYYENGTAVKVSFGTAGSNVAVGGGVSYSF
ncbi:YadA-like family protein [Bisgaard Taxon 46]